MAGGKQTPRQKLIGLMYLVFLALMALQVSREVLDSVVLIDNEINQTNINLSQRINSTLDAFRSQLTVAEERVRPIYNEANRVQELSDELVDFILNQRAEMIAHIDGIDVEEARNLDLFDLRNKDNYSSSTRFWLTAGELDTSVTGAEGSRAFELRQRIIDFKESLMPILESHDLVGRVNLGLDVERNYPAPGGAGGSINWQQNMFDRVIPVAVATNLTRLVTEVRSAEFDLINNLFSRITAGAFTFNKIDARVVPVSNIVMQGGRFEADVFLVAIDTLLQPTITLGGGPIQVRDGVGRISLSADRPGANSFSGRISIPDPAGGTVPLSFPFDGQYVVQPPSTTVSATAMNVVYVGLDNPMSISSPGVPTENLRVTATGGRLTPTGGSNYNFVPEAGAREAVITVRTAEGQSLGSQNFRVRPVPPPTAYIANRRDGRITREELAAQAGIIPVLENFEFNYNYQIASYTMTANVGGDIRRFPVQGNRFTDEIRQVINNATRGQLIVFQDIVTRPGPDGRPVNLGSITFTIQ